MSSVGSVLHRTKALEASPPLETLHIKTHAGTPLATYRMITIQMNMKMKMIEGVSVRVEAGSRTWVNECDQSRRFLKGAFQVVILLWYGHGKGRHSRCDRGLNIVFDLLHAEARSKKCVATGNWTVSNIMSSMF